MHRLRSLGHAAPVDMRQSLVAEADAEDRDLREGAKHFETDACATCMEGRQGGGSPAMAPQLHGRGRHGPCGEKRCMAPSLPLPIWAPPISALHAGVPGPGEMTMLWMVPSASSCLMRSTVTPSLVKTSGSSVMVRVRGEPTTHHSPVHITSHDGGTLTFVDYGKELKEVVRV